MIQQALKLFMIAYYSLSGTASTLVKGF